MNTRRTAPFSVLQAHGSYAFTQSKNWVFPAIQEQQEWYFPQVFIIVGANTYSLSHDV